jgi:hypothetical protein
MHRARRGRVVAGGLRMLALMLTFELLTFQPQSPRALAAIQALKASAPRGSVASLRYRGHSDVLVFWGPGAPERRAVMQRQVARGGHALALDLSYWSRDRKFRVSRSTRHTLRNGSCAATGRPIGSTPDDSVSISNRWDPAGPVIVAGIGRKARVQYGSRGRGHGNVR